MSVVLTLHYPKCGKGIPLYTSGNPHLLHLFKQVVLDEWANRAEVAGDEMEALIARAELDRLRRLLDVFIPDGDGDGT